MGFIAWFKDRKVVDSKSKVTDGGFPFLILSRIKSGKKHRMKANMTTNNITVCFESWRSLASLLFVSAAITRLRCLRFTFKMIKVLIPMANPGMTSKMIW